MKERQVVQLISI